MKFRNADGQGEEDDETLFEQAMCDVKRLNYQAPTPRPIRAASIPTSAQTSNPPLEFGEELRYVRPGIQISLLQKLRRGQFTIEATLDLHGLTGAEASTRVAQFIQQSQLAGRKAVRIIHGKGLGSAGRQPVLKTKVQEKLLETVAVLVFCSSRPQDGGTGAVDVLLRN